MIRCDFDKYLEHLAEIQAGITLKVDRPMLIDEVDQIVAPGRRRVCSELVKPGVYRLRAFRQYRSWSDARHLPFNYEYRFVLDVTKQGINGSEFQSEIWFENALTLHHVLKMQFNGVMEIDRDTWLPGTTTITYRDVKPSTVNPTNSRPLTYMVKAFIQSTHLRILRWLTLRQTKQKGNSK
jgi:hypothetical protein